MINGLFRAFPFDTPFISFVSATSFPPLLLLLRSLISETLTPRDNRNWFVLGSDNPHSFNVGVGIIPLSLTRESLETDR